MRNYVLLALVVTTLLPSWARPQVAAGLYTPFQPGRHRPDRISFNARMVGLTFARSSWEVPVESAHPGVLVLDRNPNLRPGQGHHQALRYAPGPWAGTAFFSLQARPTKWNLQDLYVRRETLERWQQLPTAPFDSREQGLSLLRDYYEYALTLPKPEDDRNLVTFFLKRGFNPQASQALLTQQELTLSEDPEFKQIIESYYSRLKRR